METNYFNSHNGDSSGFRQLVGSNDSTKVPWQQSASEVPQQSITTDDHPASTSSCHPNPPQICCLIERSQRCHEYVSSGTMVFTRSVQKVVRSKSTGGLTLKLDCRARHRRICDYHNKLIGEIMQKPVTLEGQIQSNSSSSENTESNDEDDTNEDQKGINFGKFPLTTLHKYKRLFMIPGQFSKGDLVEVVNTHFKTIPVLPDEQEIVSDFIFKTKYGEMGQLGHTNFGSTQQAAPK